MRFQDLPVGARFLIPHLPNSPMIKVEERDSNRTDTHIAFVGRYNAVALGGGRWFWDATTRVVLRHGTNPNRCNLACTHEADMHDCPKCLPFVAFECMPVCMRCVSMGRDGCHCDTAHDYEMRQLRRKQLAQDITPEEAAEECAQEQMSFDWHESHCVREGRGSCIC